jgi:ribosomal protein S18 acetylase RimI-like enzyme
LVKHFVGVWTRFGWGAALFDLVYRLFAKLLNGKVLLVGMAGTPQPDSGALKPSDLQPKVLTSREVYLTAARTPEMFDAEFAQQALERGDECLAMMEGERAVSINWHTTQPTAVKDGFFIRFGKGMVYGYKGYTLAEYRGRHLAGQLIQFAMEHYLRDRGVAGLVAYCEANNFAQRRNYSRSGTLFGFLVVFRFFGRYFTYTSPGCRACGFALEVGTGPVTAPEPVQQAG